MQSSGFAIEGDQQPAPGQRSRRAMPWSRRARRQQRSRIEVGYKLMRRISADPSLRCNQQQIQLRCRAWRHASVDHSLCWRAADHRLMPRSAYFSPTSHIMLGHAGSRTCGEHRPLSRMYGAAEQKPALFDGVDERRQRCVEVGVGEYLRAFAAQFEAVMRCAPAAAVRSAAPSRPIR
jgi:hypothetical protein